jgi:hypothetical protein
MKEVQKAFELLEEMKGVDAAAYSYLEVHAFPIN